MCEKCDELHDQIRTEMDEALAMTNSILADLSKSSHSPNGLVSLQDVSAMGRTTQLVSMLMTAYADKAAEQSGQATREESESYITTTALAIPGLYVLTRDMYLGDIVIPDPDRN